MQNADKLPNDQGWTPVHETHFTRNLKSALLAAAVVLAAAIAGLAFGISKGHDQQALQTSHRMVEAAFQGLEDRLLALTRDYAFRDEVYNAVLTQEMDRMVPIFAVQEGAEADIAVVIEPNGLSDFGWRSDMETETPRSGLVPPETLALLHDQLDAVPVADRNALSTFARFDGEIWLLAMSRVLPWDGIAPEIPDSAIPRLVMGKRLSPELLAAIGAPFLIHDLDVSAQNPRDKARFAIRDARGDILGHVTWTAPRPGWRVLANIGAPVAVITVVTVFVLIVAAFHIVGSASRLEGALIRAREANQAKSRFLATVSHELRTPVTSIIGSLDLIASGALADSPGKTSGIVGIAKNNARRLATLIEDLLQIQKMETGNLDYHFDSIRVDQAIERAIQLTRPIASNAGIRINAPHVGSDLFVRADQSRLEQVITNILSNAIKFSRPDGEVLVDVEDTLAGVRVSVTDHGIGIPAGMRDKVFAPFGQIDSSDTRSAGGSGLGLNIAQRIMEAHRGLIDYRSEEGTGSTFFIELGRVDTPAGTVRAPDGRATALAGRPERFARPVSPGGAPAATLVARSGSMT